MTVAELISAQSPGRMLPMVLRDADTGAILRYPWEHSYNPLLGYNSPVVRWDVSYTTPFGDALNIYIRSY